MVGRPARAASVAAAILAAAAPAAGLAACSGKPRTDEPAPRAPPAGDAGTQDATAGRAAAAGDAGAPLGDAGAQGAAGAGRITGDLQVRVEWVGVPVAARSSPGRTACGTPRAASVAPTTTWGIPDALVVVAGAPLPAAPPTARVTLADCALAPRLAVGATLAITSAVDRPAKVTLRKRGAVDHLADHLATGDAIPVLLPIAGHSVAAALDAGAVYSLEADAAAPDLGELAFIAPSPAQVTDATGHTIIRDLAPGAHAVTAWLPPRAGQPARTGRGSATIVAGELAELTVALTLALAP